MPCILSVLVRLQRENEYAKAEIKDLLVSLGAAEAQIKVGSELRGLADQRRSLAENQAVLREELASCI